MQENKEREARSGFALLGRREKRVKLLRYFFPCDTRVCYLIHGIYIYIIDFVTYIYSLESEKC